METKGHTLQVHIVRQFWKSPWKQHESLQHRKHLSLSNSVTFMNFFSDIFIYLFSFQKTRLVRVVYMLNFFFLLFFFIFLAYHNYESWTSLWILHILNFLTQTEYSSIELTSWWLLVTDQCDELWSGKCLRSDFTLNNYLAY